MKKERLDLIVQKQAGVSRSKAQGWIQTGKVLTKDGEVLDKVGQKIPEDTILDIRGDQRFVSRGGDKLQAALDHFNINIQDAVAIDVGASTGGFTDCLLQYGAARVYAVDVGYGQLAWNLRQDPRVVVIERTNIRHLDSTSLPERPNFFTVDCSFISLKIVLPPLEALLADNAQGIVLIKPQFEAGKGLVGKGGVVRDPLMREQIIADVLQAADQIGFLNKGVIPSPLLGPAGNQEFLAFLQLSEEVDDANV